VVRNLDDLIVRTCSRIMVPFLQIYSLYVYVHGHTSPGGGFQGGCIMAASFILLAVAYDIGEAKRRFSERLNALFCCLGVFIYAGTGAVAVIFSDNFLDYSAWQYIIPVGPIMARYYGIAMIELGVEITVMAVMVSIFLDLVTAGDQEAVLESDHD
jgi:multicomponent Na+:H+ antiporter subunit B